VMPSTVPRNRQGWRQKTSLRTLRLEIDVGSSDRYETEASFIRWSNTCQTGCGG